VPFFNMNGSRKRKSRLVASVFAVVFAGTILVGCTSPEEKAKAYYESGQSYLENKDFVRAAIEFRNALKLNEDYADAWFGMAQIEEKDRKWNVVAGNLNRVLEIDPKHLQARSALARLLLLGGNADEALRQVDLGLQNNPNDQGLETLKAAILLKVGRIQEAIDKSNTLLNANPKNIDAMLVLAAERLNANDPVGSQKWIDKGLAASPDAVSLYMFALTINEKQKDAKSQEANLRKIIALEPNQKGYRDALVAFLNNQKRFDEAEAELRRIVATNPTDLTANMVLVRFISTMPGKGPEAAISELQALIASGKDAAAYKTALAQLLFELQRQDESFAVLKESIAQEGITEIGMNARLDLSGKLISLRRFAEAEPFLAEVIANDARNVEGLRLRAAISVANGDLEKASIDVREAQNQSPGNPALEQMMATINEKKGSIELADKNMSDAFRFSSYNPAIGIEYVRFLIRRGQPERAETVLVDITEAVPGNLDALSMLADLKLRRQDWAGASQVADAIRNVSSNNALASQITAASLAGQNRLDDSVKVLLDAATASPETPQAKFTLVRGYLAAKKFPQAEEYLKTILAAEPDNAEARSLLGIVQFNLNQKEAAKQSFEAALVSDQKNTLAVRALADFHVRENQPDLAIAVLRKGLEASPRDMGLRFSLASLNERTGNVDAAIAVYEEMLRDQPDSMIAANNYASLVSDYKTDAASLEKAANAANVLRQSPIAQFRDTLGWILLLRGQNAEALELLRQSAADLPDVALTNYHLGRALEATGDKAAAAQSYERALRLASTDKERALIEAAMRGEPLISIKPAP
jgi:cellulose synthase operon protein C